MNDELATTDSFGSCHATKRTFAVAGRSGLSDALISIVEEQFCSFGWSITGSLRRRRSSFPLYLN